MPVRTMSWEFTIPGPPQPKQRARRAPAGHWYTPEATVAYENAVGWMAKAAGVKLASDRVYGVSLRIYVTRLFKDQDNIVKSVLDGTFSTVAGQANDRQVVRIDAAQVWCDAGEERVEVVIEDRGEMYEWMKDKG